MLPVAKGHIGSSFLILSANNYNLYRLNWQPRWDKRSNRRLGLTWDAPINLSGSSRQFVPILDAGNRKPRCPLDAIATLEIFVFHRFLKPNVARGLSSYTVAYNAKRSVDVTSEITLYILSLYRPFICWHFRLSDSDNVCPLWLAIYLQKYLTSVRHTLRQHVCPYIFINSYTTYEVVHRHDS